MIDLRINCDLSNVAALFAGPLSPTQVGRACRRAVNRTLITVRKIAIDQLREKINLRPSDLRKPQFIRIEKAAGGSLATIKGAVVFSKKPVPLLYFVKGSKSPRSQKGIKVKNRRLIKVEVTPGKVTTLRHGFIASVHTTQVFKRGRANASLHKQGVANVGVFIDERGMGERIANTAGTRMRDTFISELNARLNGFVKSKY